MSIDTFSAVFAGTICVSIFLWLVNRDVLIASIYIGFSTVIGISIIAFVIKTLLWLGTVTGRLLGFE